MESGDEPLLERILTHPALDGPESWHTLARMHHTQGQHTKAQALIQKALKQLPGCHSIQDTASKLGVPLG